MALINPRAQLRSFRQVPREWEDQRLQLLASAVVQLQEMMRMHPVQVVSVTADYTALDQDLVVLADATGGDITVTLPTATGREGRRIIVKKTDSSANTVTIDGNGSETIDGATTVALASQNELREIVSDLSNWYVVSSSGITAASDEGASLVLIEAKTITSSMATVEFTSGIDDTYNTYLLVLSRVLFDSNATVGFQQYHAGTVEAWRQATYHYHVTTLAANSDSYFGKSHQNANQIDLTGDQTMNTISATSRLAGWIMFHNPGSTSIQTPVEWHLFGRRSTGGTEAMTFMGTGQNDGTRAEAVTGVRIIPSTGNITEGMVDLYGIKRS